MAAEEKGRWMPVFTSAVSDSSGRPTLLIDRDCVSNVVRMHYADGTRFWLTEDTSKLWASWPETLTSEDASTYLLGPVLGYVLRLRGQVALHASAVRLPDGAVALTGPAGAGKSTTAAALVCRGYPLLCEDVCLLTAAAEGADVVPAYPLIRLWPASVEMLYGRPDALPRLTPTWDKCHFSITEPSFGFCDTPQPLRAIFLLAGREASANAPRVESVPLAEAFVHLVGNTYGNSLLSRGGRAAEFRFFQHLLQKTPVYRLIPHASSDRLDALCDLILQTAEDSRLAHSGAVAHGL
jgi:hypothetical protein